MKIQLGSGKNVFENWINVDLDERANVICDLSKGRLPFNPNSAEVIYSEHFLEHITRDEGLSLLKECYRVLKPGGVIRISTPNLTSVCIDYLNKKIDRWHDVGHFPSSPCQLVNESVRYWGHQFIYDYDELKASLYIAGFSVVDKKNWGISDHVDLSNLETRPYCEDLIVEAVK